MSHASAALRLDEELLHAPQFMGSPAIAVAELLATIGKATTATSPSNRAVLYLDAGYYIIDAEAIADDAIAEQVSQDIANKAASCKACSIILGSRQFGASARTLDEHRLLNQVVKARLQHNDVRLLDHIVIADGDNVSMALMNQL